MLFNVLVYLIVGAVLWYNNKPGIHAGQACRQKCRDAVCNDCVFLVGGFSKIQNGGRMQGSVF